MSHTSDKRRSATEPRALVVTALSLEFLAVRAHLRDLKEVVLPLGMVAETGHFDGQSGVWQVSLSEVGMGNERAALETERAIQALDPELVLFVGIAGGIKDDVRLGDVVVPYKVYAYDYGKDGETLLPRPEASEPSYRLFQHAAAVARNDRWRARIILPEGTREPHEPRVVTKAIAAGGKVVANMKSNTARLIREHYSDAVAVEMEGYGFLRALHAHPERQNLLVRGISDLVEGKEASDSQGWQPVAAAAAAAFAFEILARFSPVNVAERSQQQPSTDFWTAFREAAVRLCPAGPMHERIWERAGGDPSRLPLGSTPHTLWFDAIDLLRRGGGGEISPASLLQILRVEFPHARELEPLLANAKAITW